MMLTTAFLHMDRTEALDLFAQKKIGARIEKLAEGPISGQITFVAENGKHIVRLAVKDKAGAPIVVKEADDNIYRAVNRVAAQIDRRLRQKKERKVTLRHQEKIDFHQDEDTEL